MWWYLWLSSVLCRWFSVWFGLVSRRVVSVFPFRFVFVYTFCCGVLFLAQDLRSMDVTVCRTPLSPEMRAPLGYLLILLILFIVYQVYIRTVLKLHARFGEKLVEIRFEKSNVECPSDHYISGQE